MNRKHVLTTLSVAIVFLIATASVSAVSAATINKSINGKGSIAQFSIAGPGGAHTINAVVTMTNSEKDAQIYVSITHPLKGISVASGPVNVKWSMNHVTAEATLTFTGATGRAGTHKIALTWSTDGSASNEQLSENTGKGLLAEINGTWKLGSAELAIDDETGHHQDSVYTSSWAIVVHGTADITLT